ncbi:unnamed protein product [Angiostrongylus costaricensis]|uniref:CAP10 domain-containing protein n=1 Tax=Angiostrongylus costaricensis TaxID=334426 RepID=A0A0R3Q1L6_ANGCS|nr:unnamed protein product [Angiostrongylus costaricensis]
MLRILLVTGLSYFVEPSMFNNSELLHIPGMDMMTSDKHPHYTIVETVSRTKWHRHRREVIAGPIYDWNSYEIPYQIWGGDLSADRSNLLDEANVGDGDDGASVGGGGSGVVGESLAITG